MVFFNEIQAEDKRNSTIQTEITSKHDTSTVVPSKAINKDSKPSDTINNKSKNLKIEEKQSEDKVQKRGLALDVNYGYSDKFDHGYYLDHNLDIPLTTPAPTLTLPTFPPDYFLSTTTTTTTPSPLLHPPLPSGAINLGHTTHIHKTITFYQGIPEPYPVIKHIPIPVEKQIPVAVNIPVPVPVPVEKTIHVPIKVPVKIPVPIPHPYPVVKEVRVPVKVFVDKPYPVYVPHKEEEYYQNFDHHYHWKPEVPKPEPEIKPENWENIEEPHFGPHYHLGDDTPHFVTVQKPENNDFDKYYSASNKVEKNYQPKKPEVDHERKRPRPVTNKYKNERDHRDYYNYNNKHRDSYDHQHRDHRYHRDHTNYRDHKDQREHRQREDKNKEKQDELILHTNF